MQRNSGPLHSRIRFVTDTQGIFNSPLLLIRFFLADAGRPGDSGSLITDTLGRALGMYLGAATDPAVLTMGIATDISQAASLMDMELYR